MIARGEAAVGSLYSRLVKSGCEATRPPKVWRTVSRDISKDSASSRSVGTDGAAVIVDTRKHGAK